MEKKIDEYKKRFIGWAKFKAVLFVSILLIISLIHTSFVLVPNEQGEKTAPEWFVSYRQPARWIITNLDRGLTSFIDSEAINHEADLTYSRSITDGFTVSATVDVTLTKADGTVMKPVNGEWIPI